MTPPPTLTPLLAPAGGAALAALICAPLDLGALATALLAALGAGAGGLCVYFLARRAPGATPPASIDVAAPAAADTEALARLPAAVILVDAEQRIRRINEAAQRLIGGEEASDAVLPSGEPLVSAIRAPALIEAVEETLGDGAPRTIGFTLSRERVERALEAHVRALDPAGPRTPAALILIEDQTRMRRAEEMRQDFIANASHELRTPLASIIGFIETLQGPAKDDAAARTRFLGIMGAEAERMKRLVENLMSLSRIEMNQYVRPTEPVALGALARSTAAAMAPVAAEAGARIVLETPDDGPLTTGDRDQLAQLLINLIENAVKYGGEGVTVTIGVAAPAPEWPGMVGLVVADDGPGIAREHLPRLTERFYRVSTPRGRGAGGAGLGLAIAKHILQRHRGEMRIVSTIGEGSAFTIWLPRRRDSASAEGP
ncbi:PAS domain-containing protein [Pikeienuella piscinae]|uniref:histidine kinase n=1 Tax=Pikeienuella piscinae TaxID=2748098 RepID=A0A7L5BUX9_9RHOB|nr:ATP-binding protein [Pikeienuella piscinae]QIE53966.1 PAS domain-containing protein [Pikeienuella piscinae]